MIHKIDGVIKFKEIRNNGYDFDQIDKCKCSLNHCNIKNCCWKPIFVIKNTSKSNLDDIYDAIEASRISSNVKEFWFNGCIFITNFYELS